MTHTTEKQRAAVAKATAASAAANKKRRLEKLLATLRQEHGYVGISAAADEPVTAEQVQAASAFLERAGVFAGTYTGHQVIA